MSENQERREFASDLQLMKHRAMNLGLLRHGATLGLHRILGRERLVR